MRVRLDQESIEKFSRHKIYFAQYGAPRFRPGDIVSFEHDARVEPYSLVFSGHTIAPIGAVSYSFSEFPLGSSIGRYCSISWGVQVMHFNHPLSFVSTSSFAQDAVGYPFGAVLSDFGVTDFNRYDEASKSRLNRGGAPIIGNDVWIGQHAVLARGITLGDGCVVGANSVVTKSVPPYAIVGGNPARLIRMRFSDEIIAKLRASAWWSYLFKDFAKMRYDDPELFCDQLRAREEKGDIAPFAPPPLLVRELVESAEVIP